MERTAHVGAVAVMDGHITGLIMRLLRFREAQDLWDQWILVEDIARRPVESTSNLSEQNHGS